MINLKKAQFIFETGIFPHNVTSVFVIRFQREAHTKKNDLYKSKRKKTNEKITFTFRTHKITEAHVIIGYIGTPVDQKTTKKYNQCEISFVIFNSVLKFW